MFLVFATEIYEEDYLGCARFWFLTPNLVEISVTKRMEGTLRKDVVR